MALRMFLILSSAFFLLQCEEEPIVEPPEDLIAEPVFVDLMTELQLYDALVYTTDNPEMTDSIKYEIFDKYDVTTVQYLRSQVYYQSQIDKHLVRLDTVLSRLEKEHQSLDGTFGSGLRAE